ncbi:hypothetical protein B0H16DRAFT_727704, partial [Mycena metata]
GHPCAQEDTSKYCCRAPRISSICPPPQSQRIKETLTRAIQTVHPSAELNQPTSCSPPSLSLPPWPPQRSSAASPPSLARLPLDSLAPPTADAVPTTGPQSSPFPPHSWALTSAATRRLPLPTTARAWPRCSMESLTLAWAPTISRSAPSPSTRLGGTLA